MAASTRKFGRFSGLRYGVLILMFTRKPTLHKLVRRIMNQEYHWLGKIVKGLCIELQNAQASEYWMTDKADIRSNARMQLSFMMAYGFGGVMPQLFFYYHINQEINIKVDASNQELKASFDEKLKLNVDLLTVQLSEIKAILREQG
ncbi:hypothetical protein BGX38DRAFT_1146476 [Terfezia claveryi]|nr:hypothetical protein BGX38DRAFT_1146476 [Terfezia claveryi]